MKHDLCAKLAITLSAIINGEVDDKLMRFTINAYTVIFYHKCSDRSNQYNVIYFMNLVSCNNIQLNM